VLTVLSAPCMRRFVVIGQQATASDDFSLDDLPGSSGRLDVLLRCVRAALLVSHGLRRDVVAYLVLLGGRQAPRVLRFDGALAKFVRPDERSLATLVKKVLGAADGASTLAHDFVEVKAGIAISRGGLADVIADLGRATAYILDESGPVVRDSKDLGSDDIAFFVGDHRGFDDATRACLAAIGARPIRVGPVSLHAEDAIAIVSNEIDRTALAQASRA
jgi:tRNA (pseudouridine54-N1)-methyltransferase